MSGRLHHMDIYVADLGRSSGFWGPLLEALGWTIAVSRPAVRSWRGAGAELFLVQTEPEFAASGYHRKRVGLNHLAFELEDRAELARFHELIAASGARMLYGGEIEETSTQYRFFFEDPDGIKIEVLVGR